MLFINVKMYWRFYRGGHPIATRAPPPSARCQPGRQQHPPLNEQQFRTAFKLLHRQDRTRKLLTFFLFFVCIIIHLSMYCCSSQPSIVHCWLSSSIFPCRLFVRSSRHGDIWPNLTSNCPTPPNPYIFWKLMIIAIQNWIRNTNTKTKTNTKTMTKTKTRRE